MYRSLRYISNTFKAQGNSHYFLPSSPQFPDVPLAKLPHQKSNVGACGRVFHYGEDWGDSSPPPPPPPHRPKLWLITPYFPKPPTPFAPKLLILLFLCSFWLFWPKVPTTVDPRWKILCDRMARMLMPTITLHPDGVFGNTDFSKLACSMLFKSIHKVFRLVFIYLHL